MSGGRQSAYGYRYQYLATADHILRYLRNHLGELASIALHVEPTSLAQRGVAADDDIVDLAVEFDRVVVDKVQVKASVTHRTISCIPAKLPACSAASPVVPAHGRSY